MTEKAPAAFDTETTDLLVVGYGNAVRCDDGVGLQVAETIESLRLAGVRTLCCAQLTPELAEPISRARAVVFVDAAVDAPGRVRLRALDPAGSPQMTAHAADPRTVLALARDVFGRAPEAWWLTIPVVRLGFGYDLSALARRGAAEAVEEIKSFARRLG